MGGSNSLHVRGVSLEAAITALNRPGAGECYAGGSGDGWIGIASRAVEATGGAGTPKSAQRLSAALETHALGVVLYEDDFEIWLFLRGRLVDSFPRKRPCRFWPRKNVEHALLDLVIHPEDAPDVGAILERTAPYPFLRPAGQSEEQFIAAAYAAMKRARSMTREESEEWEEMRRKYPPISVQARRDLATVCEAMGIIHHDIIYDDSDEDPPAFGFRHTKRVR